MSDRFEGQDPIAAAVQPAEPRRITMDTDDFSETRSRGQYPSECWQWSPGRIELMSMALQRLAKLNAERGGPREIPEKVRAAVVMPDKLLYLFPADPDGHVGLRLVGEGSSRFVNLRKLLGKHHLWVEQGCKSRFPVEFAGPDSPVGAALVVDLNQELEKTRIPESKSKKKAKKASAAAGPAPAPEATALSSAAGPAPKADPTALAKSEE